MKNKNDLIVRLASLILVFTSLCSLYFAMAEKGVSPDKVMAESLHGHGSLNVVIAIISIILTGLFITLWRIDRKVARLENEMKEKK